MEPPDDVGPDFSWCDDFVLSLLDVGEAKLLGNPPAGRIRGIVVYLHVRDALDGERRRNGRARRISRYALSGPVLSVSGMTSFEG